MPMGPISHLRSRITSQACGLAVSASGLAASEREPALVVDRDPLPRAGRTRRSRSPTAMARPALPIRSASSPSSASRSIASARPPITCSSSAAGPAIPLSGRDQERRPAPVEADHRQARSSSPPGPRSRWPRPGWGRRTPGPRRRVADHLLVVLEPFDEADPLAQAQLVRQPLEPRAGRPPADHVQLDRVPGPGHRPGSPGRSPCGRPAGRSARIGGSAPRAPSAARRGAGRGSRCRAISRNCSSRQPAILERLVGPLAAGHQDHVGPPLAREQRPGGSPATGQEPPPDPVRPALAAAERRGVVDVAVDRPDDHLGPLDPEQRDHRRDRRRVMDDRAGVLAGPARGRSSRPAT